MKKHFFAPFIMLACLLYSCKSSSTSDSTGTTTAPTEADTVRTAYVDSTHNPEGFVLLTDVIPDAILEIRYYSTYNFAGTRIDGYLQPIALLTVEAANALKKVSDELKEQGYRLKIYDAYRPQQAVDHFVRWSKNPNDTLTKQYFYPMFDKPYLFDNGYIARRSGHTRGSTVDLTLFDMRTEKEVDMGGTFDWFGIESHPSYTATLTRQQIAMIKHGFKPIETEWWHFTLKNEPYPNTYFNHPVYWNVQ